MLWMRIRIQNADPDPDGKNYTALLEMKDPECGFTPVADPVGFRIL